MAAQYLASELATLIQDSKRKNVDIRNAAEKSLSELKSLPNTSDLQLAADLRRRPNFVRPFLLSCASKNPKFAGTSIGCLQRLVVTHGLAQETLKDTLDVLRDCTSLAQDIQLRILQLITSFPQNYASFLTGELLVTALHICFLLIASKAGVISNTAAATLQQLVVAVFGRVVQEDEVDGDPVADVPVEDSSISVREAALDACRLLNDMCLLTEGHKPTFLRPASMSQNFGLEILESILSNYIDTITLHPELIHILRIRLIPFIIRVLSERVMFSTTVRTMRLLQIILGNMLSVLPSECEMALGLMNHMLDPEAAALWKRVLCMEVFRNIHSDSTLMRSIYSHFDDQESKKNIIKDHMSILVRLGSEKPLIIGLGAQSSVPASSSQMEDELDEMSALQAEGVAGTIGVAMTLRASTAPGISTRLSTMRVPCLDQLDKNDPPAIPPAYLYTLALSCMNSFSEGLAKFLLPFTLPGESKSRRKQRSNPDNETTKARKDEESEDERSESQREKLSRTPSGLMSKIPTNPLLLEGHVLFSQIQTAAHMIDACWPPLLAAYSTFLRAALDSEYYHALIRSFQKFTQVSGLLRLSTPRDAFLTALGKNAVPLGILSISATPSTPSVDTRESKKKLRTVSERDHNSAHSAGSTDKSRQSLETNRASLNTRNLLCLRALLNLGIALGPILQTAWSIILETLQQADLIIKHIISQKRSTRNGQSTPAGMTDTDFLGDIGNEIAAVQIAATRMLESSSDLPDDSFLDMISSLSGLLRNLNESFISGDEQNPPTTYVNASSHSRSASISGRGYAPDPQANLFVVENIGKVVEFNTPRLTGKRPRENGWHIITTSLISIVMAQHFDEDLRLKAAGTICELVKVTASAEVKDALREEIRLEGLLVLTKQIQCLYHKRPESKTSKMCDLEIHWASLDVLHTTLEQYGDTLGSGWNHVFSIISSVFEPHSIPSGYFSLSQGSDGLILTRSPKLTRTAFDSLQLVCSDFLLSIPRECFHSLIESVFSFCAQQDEFNISLTSTSLFCAIAEDLSKKIDEMRLDHAFDEHEVETGDLGEIAHSIMLMKLLRLLVQTTVDTRTEIRQSGIYSIFRILEFCNDKFRPIDWLICQKHVVHDILQFNEKAYQNSVSTPREDKIQPAISSWNETAIVLLAKSSDLLRSCLGLVIQNEGFASVWIDYIQHLKALVRREDCRLSCAVFEALAVVISSIGQERESLSANCTGPVWKLWAEGNPASHKDSSQRSGDNQAALQAYLQCLAELYHLLPTGNELDTIQVILQHLRVCVVKSTPTQYVEDVDNPTQLQSQVVSIIELIKPGDSESVSALIRCLSDFVRLAYETGSARKVGTGPTYVALSKLAMDLLEKRVSAHKDFEGLYVDGGYVVALRALLKPLSLKYQWKLEGKGLPTWKKATTAAIGILKPSIHELKTLQGNEGKEFLAWTEIIRISSAVLSSHADDADPIEASWPAEDEDFDIDAFNSIYGLIVPTLGSAPITEARLRQFASSIFRFSLIHTPHPDDLPSSQTDILKNIFNSRIGSTDDIHPTPRMRMSYVLLEKLFAIAAGVDESEEGKRLADAVASFLVLRIGLVLKTYSLDQPLRGRMPQPASQRKELLYVLSKLTNLVASAEGSVSVARRERFLTPVYGFITKALVVSRRDAGIQNALMEVAQLSLVASGS